jgi:hypothetical protein
MSEGKGSGAYPHYPGKERAAHLAGKRIASMPLSHGSIRAERGDTIYGAPLLPKNEQGGVWSRGSRIVTLPRPHGARSTLFPVYIGKVIKEIELAELEAQGDNGKDNGEEDQ